MRSTGWVPIEVAVVRAVRPTGWVPIEVAVVRAVSPTEKATPSKVEVVGLFFGAAFSSGGFMKQKRLGLYTVDMKLIRNYHNQGDDNVFSVSPQIGKDIRPFVGIVIICDEKQYCVPLSSPKAKHAAMKNGVDFLRVLDSHGKLIGVLDFNNMIPVRADVLRKINIRIDPDDSETTKYYKNLVIDQITFCQKNQDTIVGKANKLYQMVGRKNTSFQLKRRCLNWKKLEAILNRYQR